MCVRTKSALLCLYTAPGCSSVLCDCRKYFRPPAVAEPLAVMVCVEFCWRDMQLGASHTVENHATGRDKRNNPTKTVYVVYYQTPDGTGCQWKLETSNDKDYANQILAKGESVDRRVLSINENGKYMIVDADLTAGII